MKHILLALLLPSAATSIPPVSNIHPSADASLCLDVAGGSSANGTKVQIAKCNGGPAQQWTQKGNTFQVFGNKCLDVTGGNTAPFTQLQIYDCGDYKNVNQQFIVSNYTISWSGKGMCLDVPNATFADGQPIKTYPCNAQDKAQQFTFASLGSVPAPAPVTAPTSTTTTAPTPTPSQGGRLMNFVNRCNQSVTVALQNNGGKAIPSPSGFNLAPNQQRSVALPYQWGGRMWGRTGCNVNGASAQCETGDAGGLMQPNGIGGQPSSLVEFLFDGWAGPNATQDYYDISLVDAFNLPVAITPTGGTGVCKAPVCSVNILDRCPADLQVKNASGAVVNCLSSCTKYQTDETCCRGAHATPQTCPAPEGARVFKQACPDAYSYAYDDGTSTWNCTAPSGYVITFCP